MTHTEHDDSYERKKNTLIPDAFHVKPKSFGENRTRGASPNTFEYG